MVRVLSTSSEKCLIGLQPRKLSRSTSDPAILLVYSGLRTFTYLFGSFGHVRAFVGVFRDEVLSQKSGCKAKICFVLVGEIFGGLYSNDK